MFVFHSIVYKPYRNCLKFHERWDNTRDSARLGKECVVVLSENDDSSTNNENASIIQHDENSRNSPNNHSQPEEAFENNPGNEIVQQHEKSRIINQQEGEEPVVDRQTPRSSADFFDLRHTCWNDLKEDDQQRVQLYLLRVYLPDLCSFDSLKTMTSKKSSKLFDRRMLITFISLILSSME